jgi:hypothetical protein
MQEVKSTMLYGKGTPVPSGGPPWEALMLELTRMNRNISLKALSLETGMSTETIRSTILGDRPMTEEIYMALDRAITNITTNRGGLKISLGANEMTKYLQKNLLDSTY